MCEMMNELNAGPNRRFASQASPLDSSPLESPLLFTHLGGERPLSNPSAVRLNSPEDPVKLPRRNSKPSQNRSNRRVTRRNVRVRSKVNIEHGSVRTFHENLLPRVIRLVGELDGIAGHGLNVGCDFSVVVELLFDVDF